MIFIDSESPSPLVAFSCQLCTVQCANEESLEEHTNRVHGGGCANSIANSGEDNNSSSSTTIVAEIAPQCPDSLLLSDLSCGMTEPLPFLNDLSLPDGNVLMADEYFNF